MAPRASRLEPRAGGSAVLDPAFELLVDRAFREVLRSDPVRASWLGLRDEAGALERAASEDSIAQEIDTLRSLRCDFESSDPARLHPEQALDRELVLGRLTALLEQLDARPKWRTMPQAPVEEILSAVLSPLLRDGSPSEARWAELLRRLEQAPALLRGATVTLNAPPSCFTETASAATEAALRALPDAIEEACREIGEGALSRSIQGALVAALDALRSYAEFLRGDLMPRSHGDFRLGASTLERLLWLDYRLPFTLDELVQLGERTYHETLREIRATSAAIRPEHNWSQVLLELTEEQPAEAELLAAYRAAVDGAREFARARDFLPFPSDDDFRIAATPAFARPSIPHALYLACGRFGSGGRGLYLVTTPDPTAPAARRREALRWHSRHALPMRAAREAYPGRHALHAILPRCGRKLRLLCPSPLFTEGWTLYAEGLMSEAGYARDDRVRFLQLRERLLCACRILTDVALHSGQLSPNEAVAFLIRKAKLDRASATAEVRRCCEQPALPLSCLVGMLLWRDLRDDWQRDEGRTGGLRAFHAAVLSHGAIPFDLLRRELGLPPSREGRDLLRVLAPSPRAVTPSRLR